MIAAGTLAMHDHRLRLKVVANHLKPLADSAECGTEHVKGKGFERKPKINVVTLKCRRFRNRSAQQNAVGDG